MDDDERQEAQRSQKERDVWALWDRRIRDAVIFLVGVLGTLHELFVVPEPRLSALLFLGSLIGIPFVLPDNFRGGK